MATTTGTMRAIGSAAKPSGAGGVVASIFIFVFFGAMATILLAVGIWPGEVKLVAPLFCSDAQPDAFVVSDTYSNQPGETSVNFTLYCMGPNGDATDHGYFLPFLATAGLNTLVLAAIVAVLAVVGRLRARRPNEPDETGAPDGSTAGPFVS